MALLEKKKNSNKSKAQQSDTLVDIQDEEMVHTPHVTEAVANVSIEPDPTSPPNKRLKNNLPKAPSSVSKHILESASSSSVGLGIDMSSAVVLHAADQKKLSSMNLVSCGEQVMTFASQVMLWSREQVALSKAESDRLSELEKAVDDTRKKLSYEQQKVASAEAKLKKIEADAAAREAQFKEKNLSLEKKLQESENAKLDAQATWYGVGIDTRLQMVKDAKLDFTKCMFDYKLDAWKTEQAEAASGVGNVVPNARGHSPLQEDMGET